MKRLLVRCLIGAVMLSVVVASPVTARGTRTDKAIEMRVKAAFIYKFSRYVQWPGKAFEGPHSPFVIGILGNDPFGSILEKTVHRKKVGRRDLVIRRFQKVDQIDSCHILFISSSEDERLEEVLKALEGKSILTVGETPGFARRDGVIGFLVEKRRVRFEINLEAAKNAGLQIRSQLLKVARLVDTNSTR